MDLDHFILLLILVRHHAFPLLLHRRGLGSQLHVVCVPSTTAWRCHCGLNLVLVLASGWLRLTGHDEETNTLFLLVLVFPLLALVLALVDDGHRVLGRLHLTLCLLSLVSLCLGGHHGLVEVQVLVTLCRERVVNILGIFGGYTIGLLLFDFQAIL